LALTESLKKKGICLLKILQLGLRNVLKRLLFERLCVCLFVFGPGQVGIRKKRVCLLNIAVILPYLPLQQRPLLM
jgi:hypothetical protein